MNNPYEVLEVSQNASKKDIKRACVLAMKKRKYSLQEIHMAEKQLLIPSNRLIADFMYPSRIRAKRPKPIMVRVKPDNINIQDINENAFDSLKSSIDG